MAPWRKLSEDNYVHWSRDSCSKESLVVAVEAEWVAVHSKKNSSGHYMKEVDWNPLWLVLEAEMAEAEDKKGVEEVIIAAVLAEALRL